MGLYNGFHSHVSGWWFGSMEFYDFPMILGMESSSQLLLTPSFFRGAGIPLTSHPVNMSGRTPGG